MLLFPYQRRPLYFRGYLIHTRLYIVDGRYASCPTAYYKRRLFTGGRWRILQHTLLYVLSVTTFREHDEGLHEEGSTKFHAARTVSSAHPRVGGGAPAVEYV